MAYFLDKREFFDGDLVLFHRNLDKASPLSKKHRTPVWHMRVKTGGDPAYFEKSTKKTDFAEAQAFARDEYFTLRHAVKNGIPIREHTFEEYWKQWYERNVLLGVWTDSRQKWHKSYAERYFFKYFRDENGKSMKLSSINHTKANKYWAWRITYWTSQEGSALLNSNPRRRSSKTRSSKNAKSTPSAKTLQMEATALNQIFRSAHEDERCSKLIKFKPPQSRGAISRRPHFDEKDFEMLCNNLQDYAEYRGLFVGDTANSWHQLHRKQLYHFVLFLANTGLRVGEARQLTWSDIKFDQAVPGSDAKIAEIRVSRYTKTGLSRNVQAQPTANEVLKAWREISPYIEDQHPVWFGQSPIATGRSPQKFGDFNKSFQQFLKSVKVETGYRSLLTNADGERRTLYSLRHTYATMRLQAHVRISDLAINMGCKIQQIENHYSHVETRNRRREITMPGPLNNEVSAREALTQECFKAERSTPDKKCASQLHTLEINEVLRDEFGKVAGLGEGV